MKFSEKWLREWVNPALDAEQLVAQITLAGLEVDSVEPVAAAFTGVVVGQIVSAEPHPNADKLQVCQVSDGQQTYQVVCGAPNARAGLITAFAQIGAELPGDFKIKKAKLRQVESNGMLCSAQELGLSEDHSGIMELPADAPVGVSLREYLKLDDVSVDVDLTPNRSDCLSIRGLAREVGVLNQVDVRELQVEPVAPSHDQVLPVELLAADACPRYLGRIIRGINPGAATPLWMQEKLRRSGLRCIDPAVDVTNYVMLELGQPMHAFDLANLHGGIRVRLAEEGETLTLLDGAEAKLNADTLVIADHQGPVAMAGIMGGEHSGINDATADIFLECAYFNPLAIAGRARRHGLHTDSSHRYERGVDPELQALAMEYATRLLLEIVGGEAGPVIVAESAEHLPKRAQVTLRKSCLAMMLATELPEAEVTAILARLGLQPQLTSDGWLTQVPSWRFDISLEVDLIEEIARVYGYNNLPSKQPTAALELPALPEAQLQLGQLRQTLIARGYQEAITFSFIEPKLQQQFDPAYQALALANPISADLAVMRTSLWPGLVKAVVYNQNRQQDRVRLFETGLRFVPTADGLVQEKMLSGVLAGSRQPEGWHGKAEALDFYDLKGDIEALLALSGQAWQWQAAEHHALHPGQSARILNAAGEELGYVGRLHPTLHQQLDVTGPLYLFELRVKVLQQGSVSAFQGVSKFPEVRRDLAVVVQDAVNFADLAQSVRHAAGEYLQDVVVFDVYAGKGVAENHKSVALGLTWQHPSRTLTDEEITTAVANVINELEQQHQAVLRS